MSPSSILCRTQEALHRDRAAGATLENVRLVAANAAAAWALEAGHAERREARGLRARAIADLTAVQQSRPGEEEERGSSENPDRGFEAA